MDFRLESHAGRHFLFAASHLDQLHEHVFTTAYWQVRGALGQPLGGRGSAWRIHEDGIDWVLRHYLRGGAVRHLVRDWYVYTGLSRTRPWREFHLLGNLRAEGLPVPEPVAARIVVGLVGYRGSILTGTLPGKSLGRLLSDGLAHSQWRAVGRAVRRLHDAGAWHADLNANNILVDGDTVSVIDWDRGERRHQDTAWRESNLSRLKRSLDKLAGEQYADAVKDGWVLLKEGYVS